MGTTGDSTDGADAGTTGGDSAITAGGTPDSAITAGGTPDSLKLRYTPAITAGTRNSADYNGRGTPDSAITAGGTADKNYITAGGAADKNYITAGGAAASGKMLPQEPPAKQPAPAKPAETTEPESADE